MAENNRNWFEWYCEQYELGKTEKELKGYSYSCPACGYPTLGTRGGFEICTLCHWEDDGQDNHNSEAILGGPNSDYSLQEARLNFEKFSTSYRPSDSKAYNSSVAHIDKLNEMRQILEKHRWQGCVNLSPEEAKSLKEYDKIAWGLS